MKKILCLGGIHIENTIGMDIRASIWCCLTKKEFPTKSSTTSDNATHKDGSPKIHEPKSNVRIDIDEPAVKNMSPK